MSSFDFSKAFIWRPFRAISRELVFADALGHWLGRWGRTVRSGVWLALLAASGLRWPCGAAAHDVLTNFVNHTVRLTLDAQHLDLTIDLAFFEEWSARERKVMDADANGKVTRSELECYLKKLAPELSQLVKLRVAGRDLALVPLYEPEIDLLGNDRAGPAHHRLRLFFFVSTPAGLGPGDDLVVVDRLWPEASALVVLQAEGRDDCALEALNRGDPGSVTLHRGEARVCKFRCLEAPHAKPKAR